VERPKLTPELAERIINLLRDNPGVSMTLADISDETDLPVEDLAVYLAELTEHNLIVNDTTPDAIDVYRFPDEYQTGTTAVDVP